MEARRREDASRRAAPSHRGEAGLHAGRLRARQSSPLPSRERAPRASPLSLLTPPPTNSDLQYRPPVVLQLLDRLVDVGERLVLALLGEARPGSPASSAAPAPSACSRPGCGSGSRLPGAACSAPGSAGPGRWSCRTSARRPAARAARRNASISSSTSASVSAEARTASISPERACVALFQLSMPSSTASLWCTTRTGPSATTLQVLVGDHQRDLEDAVGLGPQPAHLQVDPDEVGASCAIIFQEFSGPHIVSYRTPAGQL